MPIHSEQLINEISPNLARKVICTINTEFSCPAHSQFEVSSKKAKRLPNDASNPSARLAYMCTLTYSQLIRPAEFVRNLVEQNLVAFACSTEHYHDACESVLESFGTETLIRVPSSPLHSFNCVVK